MTKMAKYRKGLVAFLVAVVGGGIAQGLIVGKAAAWCTIVIGALVTAGVVAAPNQTHADIDPEAGSVEPGSLALGLVVGLLLAVVLWHPR